MTEAVRTPAMGSDSHDLDRLSTQSNLTWSQLLLWLGQEIYPASPMYNMAHAIWIDGPVDVERFREAWSTLVSSHDVLRLRFGRRDGAPFQWVDEKTKGDCDILDFTGSPDPEGTVRRWAGERTRRVFVLDHKAVDSALIKLGPERFVWYLNEHHLVTDAWSTALETARMSDLYLGKAPEAPPPSFMEHVAREAAFRMSEPALRAVEHWHVASRRAHSHALYGRTPALVSPHTERIGFALTPERTSDLDRRISEAPFRALTPQMARFNLLATVLAAFLHRVSGDADICFGTPAHNRSTAIDRQTAGLFIELFPLCALIEPGMTFVDAHDVVRRATADLLRHARPAASRGVPGRALNVVLNPITAPIPHLFGLPTRAEWVHSGHGDAPHHLRLQVHQYGEVDRLYFDFDANADLFDEELRRAMPGHFRRLLDAAIDAPEREIDAVALVNPQEARRLVLLSNVSATAGSETTPEQAPGLPIAARGTDARSQGPPAATGGVVDLFGACVRERPDAPAIRQENEAISYGTLDRWADEWAARLVQAGVQSGDRVGLFLPRSADLIAALLGIFKTGAAYVPIASDTPADRVRFVLEDASVRSLVSTSSLLKALGPLPEGVNPIAADLPDLDTPGRGGSHAWNPPSPASPAYVMYTSGSTGTPKGVIISHRALASYVNWASGAYADHRPVSFPLFTSPAFDLTVTSLFLPLVTGGSIVIYPETTGAADTTIERILEEDAVDIVKLTPSHLALIRGRRIPVRRLRALILGGEDLRRDVALSARESLGDHIHLYNEYGPTEATVGCMIHRFDPGRDTGASVPIGRGLPHTDITIRDASGLPVPQGVTGEICVAGISLADGYLNRPEASSSRFVSDPLDPHRRLYRTGDLARADRSGTVTYLGRADGQVKIRGSRIELGEIETVLAEHPAVQDCVAGVVTHQVDSREADPLSFCSRCGLPSNFPGATYDRDGVCHLCRGFESFRERAERYFRSMEDLHALFEEGRSKGSGAYDCLVLLSGGKDSTYVLGQLVEMGLNVRSLTLDNGYISDQALANIRRVTEHFGVDHVFAKTPAMNAIFVDSLKRHSNVCNGCFKALYTLALEEARRHGIRFIVTGLSRGQFFETRLTEELFLDDEIDADRIDLTILEARKAYHRVDDAVRRELNPHWIEDEAVLDEIRFVDFYRYCDVTLEDLYRYLSENVPWYRPTDTGRSTNCLINDVGIYVHKKERGYHNYAFPYSWDVRIGHKTREETLEELDDPIDEGEVRRMLREIGYEGEPGSTAESSDQLAVWYVADRALSPSELREWMSGRLIEGMVPSHFVRMEALPLTSNGKVDRSALPRPGEERPEMQTVYAAPRTETETLLAGIWENVLRVDRVGIHDNFFDLGGDSIRAIQIVARARQLGMDVTPATFFEHQTVAELARASAPIRAMEPEIEEAGDAPLTPIQHWYFEKGARPSSRWVQIVPLEAEGSVTRDLLEQALTACVQRHDALRLAYQPSAHGVRQRVLSEVPVPAVLERHDPTTGRAGKAPIETPESHAVSPGTEAESPSVGEEADRATEASIREALLRAIDPTAGSLLAAALVRDDAGGRDRILLAAHHLAVDGVSWSIIVDELDQALRAGLTRRDTAPPARTTAFRRWAIRLEKHARSETAPAELPHWRSVLSVPSVHLPESDIGPFGVPEAESAERLLVLSPRESVGLLQRLQSASRVTPHEAMLGALVWMLAEWTGQGAVRIDVEGHGRHPMGETLDLSRTVGWLTALYPVAIDLNAPLSPATAQSSDISGATAGRSVVISDPLDVIRAVRLAIRKTPAGGVGFGALRYLGEPAVRTALSGFPASEVLFNYLGRLDPPSTERSLLRPGGPLELVRDPELRRSHRLEVNAWALEGQITVSFRAAEPVDPERLEARIEHFRSRLATLVDAAITHGPMEADEVPPSEPSVAAPAGLDAKNLAKLSSLLRKADAERRS